jgi:hypothetical protein
LSKLVKDVIKGVNRHANSGIPHLQYPTIIGFRLGLNNYRPSGGELNGVPDEV